MNMQHVLTGVFFSFLLTLTACGGGGGGGNPSPTPTPDPDPDPTPQTYSVGGMISGNTNGIALSLNGSAQSFTGGVFAFTTELDDGETYNVQFVSAGANETCTVTNASGSIAGADVTSIDVTCSQVSAMSILQYNNTAITGTLDAGDFNGDGFEDLAFSMITLEGPPSGSGLNLIRFAFGNGLGAFANTFDVTTECRATSKRQGRFLSFDANADGFDDLVCAGPNIGLDVFTGNAAGEPESGFMSFERDMGVFTSVDVDQDGLDDILDLAWSGSQQSFFGYYANLGSGDFEVRSLFATESQVQNASG